MIVTKERVLIVEIREQDIDLFISAISKLKQNEEKAGFERGLLTPDEKDVIKSLNEKLL